MPKSFHARLHTNINNQYLLVSGAKSRKDIFLGGISNYNLQYKIYIIYIYSYITN